MFKKYLILIPVLFSIFVLAYKIDKPFVGHHDFMGAFIGKMAIDILQNGSLSIGWIHYLPTLPLLVSTVFTIFEISEWVIRFVPATFSVVGVMYFYLLSRKLWNIQVAFLAAFFYLFTPMFIYFGKLPAPDPIILAMLVASFYYYLLWIDKEKGVHLFFLCTFFLIAALIGWPSGYFPVLLILHSIIVGKFKKLVFLPMLIFILTLILQFGYIFIKTGQFITNDMIATLKFRLVTSNLNFGGLDFTLANYLRQEISWFQAYFTRSLIILSFVYWLKNLNLRLNIQKSTVLFFLLFGILHPIIFSRYVFIHDFLNIYLLPYFALSAALGVEIVVKILDRLKINKIVTLGFVVLIFVVFLLERIEFTKALLNTKMNESGFIMANLLNNLQESPNEAVILSPRFDSFYGVFARFYSKHSFAISEEENLINSNKVNSFKYIIVIDEDISNRNFFNFLTTKYRFKKEDGLTIFYTDEKK